ncbi:hypothetical protein OAM14_03355 [Candidatus Pelagibacter sp.]|nr:hypothetical protein [Candidatus Pelagibacter sp.]
MDSSVIYKSLFIFLILITQVKSIEFNGKFFQGHFIVGKTDPSAKIIIDKKVSKEGYFVFGIDRDRKFDLKITKILDNKKKLSLRKFIKENTIFKELMDYLRIK